MTALFDRLDLTIEAEFAACEADGRVPHECIAPAPHYYWGLWEKRSANLQPITVNTPPDESTFRLQYAMAA